MLGRPTGFWGKLKKDEDGVVIEWHPLTAHCADVAACTEALLMKTSIGKRLAYLAGLPELDRSTVHRLGVLSALHDIGKFNHGFQRKAEREPRDVAGHVQEVASAFQGNGRFAPEADAIVQAVLACGLAEWAPDGSSGGMLLASIGHHGRPVAPDTSFEARLFRAQPDRDPIAGIAALVSQAMEWFPEAREGRTFLPVSPPVQHLFSGLVMLADWLGSDTKFFPYSQDDDEDRMPFARAAADQAIREVGLDLGPARKALGASEPTFKSISDFDPRLAQQLTLDLQLHPAGSLTILESETGSGKTEAALARFLRLFHAGLVDGMTFALPTRTSATQIHARVFEAVQRAFPDEETAPSVILAVPGYLQVDDQQGRRLPGFEVLWNDDAKERFRYRAWAAENPKRYLAGGIVVGTIDQVLLSTLRVSHSHLRAAALSRHLLVVDEVHASDAYMSTLLECVLKYHAQAGGHAFLMSATLGSETRGRFEAAGRARSKPSLNEALQLAYPVVHNGMVGQTFVAHPIAQTDAQKRIVLEVVELSDDYGAVAALALAAARRGARVVVIRNTVDDARQTQRAVEGQTEGEESLLFQVNGVTTLHHSRYCRDDRRALDGEVERRLGKHAPQQGGVVVVATQTIEQSLDLDADLMLTDLAPIDVLLQRFGRVHRHRERNPHRHADFEIPRAVILTGPSSLGETIKNDGEARGPHGWGTVYSSVLILEATRRLLLDRGELTIPKDNREVVERCLHSEPLGVLAAELGERWMDHHVKVFGSKLAKSFHAQQNVVDRTKELRETSFSREINEKISTRLGDDDRRVVFQAPLESPLGEKVKEVTLPGRWFKKHPGLTAPDEVALREEVAEGERRLTFQIGELEFFYDRLGLEQRGTVR